MGKYLMKFRAWKSGMNETNILHKNSKKQHLHFTGARITLPRTKKRVRNGHQEVDGAANSAPYCT